LTTRCNRQPGLAASLPWPCSPCSPKRDCRELCPKTGRKMPQLLEAKPLSGPNDCRSQLSPVHVSDDIEDRSSTSMAEECIGIDQQFPGSMPAGRDATCSRRSLFAWDLTGSRSGDMEGNLGAWEPGSQEEKEKGPRRALAPTLAIGCCAAAARQDAAPVPEYRIFSFASTAQPLFFIPFPGFFRPLPRRGSSPLLFRLRCWQEAKFRPPPVSGELC
jgi:hypothetical protein